MNGLLLRLSKKRPKIFDFILKLRPTITADPLTGSPEISFKLQNEEEQSSTINQLFNYLNNLDKPILIAIDEFQQINKYPEKNCEAILRSSIQRLQNVNFIFCGSNKHMLTEIFSNVKRPFYGSTQMLYLEEIPESLYHEFIKRHFEASKKEIDDECVSFILDFTRIHTYYTQVLCNKVFGKNTKKLNLSMVQTCAHELLSENEAIYYQYRKLITNLQWRLMVAIAKEKTINQPTEKAFLIKYKFGNSSSVLRSLNSLIDKEMVYKTDGADGASYRVYDTFLSRWMERLPL